MLRSVVIDGSNQTAAAITWWTPVQTAITPISDLTKHVRDDVSDQTDTFANAYLSVNTKEVSSRIQGRGTTDKNARDALVEIYDLLKQKVRFDIVKRRDAEMLAEAGRLSVLIDKMIEKLSSTS